MFKYIFLSMGVLALTVGPWACKKKDSPTAPPPSATATFTPTVTLSPTATQCTTRGASAYDTDFALNGAMIAQAITLSAPATLRSINFRLYLAPTPGIQAKVGVYSDSSNYPQTLVTVSTPTAPTNGWNQISVAPVSLAAGSYWMTLEPVGGPLDYSCNSAVSNPSLMADGDFPSTFPSGATTLAYGDLTVYMEFCP
jgi:hypothetical protein